jgi:uncharacterized protein YaeQ
VPQQQLRAVVEADPEQADAPNLTVLRLPVTNSQGLAMLAERTMRLQCLVQDGEVWISSDAQRIRVKLKTLKEPQR